MNKEDIITGNAFKSIADDFLDEEVSRYSKCFYELRPIDISKKPKIIFLKTDWMEDFKQKVLPQIDYNFKLITHNGDWPVTSNNIDLLEDPRLIKWYGMNCQIKHPKLQPIPIGIANEQLPHGNKDELLEIINTDIPKIHLCYSNFDITTNFLRRPEIYEIIKTKTFVDIETQKLPYKQYLTKLKSYKYVISPPGNSIDCHRIWESIYLGVIPIVEKHLAMEYFYDLPILFIDSFNDVTLELLNTFYDEIIAKSVIKAKIKHYQEMLCQI